MSNTFHIARQFEFRKVSIQSASERMPNHVLPQVAYPSKSPSRYQPLDAANNSGKVGPITGGHSRRSLDSPKRPFFSPFCDVFVGLVRGNLALDAELEDRILSKATRDGPERKRAYMKIHVSP
jgi:hypothetical protein